MFPFKTFFICIFAFLAFTHVASGEWSKPVYERSCYKSRFGTPSSDSCKAVCDKIKETEKGDTVTFTKDGKERVWEADSCVMSAKNTVCGVNSQGVSFKKIDGQVHVQDLLGVCKKMRKCLKKDEAALYQSNNDKGEPGSFAATLSKESEFPPETHQC